MSTEMSASSQRLLLSAGRECFISLISHPRATGSRDLHHTRDPADPTNPRPPREALADQASANGATYTSLGQRRGPRRAHLLAGVPTPQVNPQAKPLPLCRRPE
jgi:hypothetical protein